MPIKRSIEKAKRRWGVESTARFWIIMLVFSLAGLAVTRIKAPLFAAFHIPDRTPTWVWVPLYLVVMLPVYQVLLLFFAALLGQFRFFWEKEKKLGRWLARTLSPKVQSQS